MIEVIVARKHREAEGIYSFELVSADGSALPAFTPGAHVDVQMTGDGPQNLVRQYSLFNGAEAGDRYCIAVLRSLESRGGSVFMHDQVEEGTRLRISPPRNLFELAPKASSSLLFAGGIGITPILSMARHLAATQQPFELHYCARSSAGAAFVDTLKQSPFEGSAHSYFDDLGPANQLSLGCLQAPEPGRHLYVCGPSGFMDFILNSARSAGWAEENLHREYFAASPQPEQAGEDFKIKIASTGAMLDVPAGKSAAQVLIESGIDVPLSCEQGICGTCITRVLDGVPDHQDMFLTDAERALNDRFTPCCSRSQSACLVLDL